MSADQQKEERTGFPYWIRFARADEWEPIMKVVWRTFLKFEAADYSEEGIRNFLEFITDESLYHSFLRGEYRVLVALDHEQVIGVASVRNLHHLSLLFVDADYHRQGVGRKLLNVFCDCLKKDGETCMTVNAAPYAVGFYKKLGFKELGPETDVKGIRVTGMEKQFEF